jgi:hypothetical protein
MNGIDGWLESVGSPASSKRAPSTSSRRDKRSSSRYLREGSTYHSEYDGRGGSRRGGAEEPEERGRSRASRPSTTREPSEATVRPRAPSVATVKRQEPSLVKVRRRDTGAVTVERQEPSVASTQATRPRAQKPERTKRQMPLSNVSKFDAINRKLDEMSLYSKDSRASERTDGTSATRRSSRSRSQASKAPTEYLDDKGPVLPRDSISQAGTEVSRRSSSRHERRSDSRRRPESVTSHGTASTIKPPKTDSGRSGTYTEYKNGILVQYEGDRREDRKSSRSDYTSDAGSTYVPSRRNSVLGKEIVRVSGAPSTASRYSGATAVSRYSGASGASGYPNQNYDIARAPRSPSVASRSRYSDASGASRYSGASGASGYPVQNYDVARAPTSNPGGDVYVQNNLTQRLEITNVIVNGGRRDPKLEYHPPRDGFWTEEREPSSYLRY